MRTGDRAIIFCEDQGRAGQLWGLATRSGCEPPSRGFPSIQVSAIRIDYPEMGYAALADTYHEADPDYGLAQYPIRLNAETQWQEVENFFNGGQMELSNTSEGPTGIVVVVDRYQPLMSWLQHALRDSGFPGLDGVNWSDQCDTVLLGPNGVGGWNGAGDRQWYARQAAYRDYPYMSARTQQAEILSWIYSRAPVPIQCAVVVGDRERSAALQNMAFNVGARWIGEPGPAVMRQGDEVLWFERNTGGMRISCSSLEWAKTHSQPGVPLYSATTQWPLIERFFKQYEPKPMPEIKPPELKPGERPNTKMVVIIHSQESGRIVESMAIDAGYYWTGRRGDRGWKLPGQIASHISLGAYAGSAPDEHRVIRHDCYRDTFDMSAPTYRTNVPSEFEALKAQLLAIRKWAEDAATTAPKRPYTSFVSPPLLHLIQSQPGEAMVRGFIRRDFKLKLPEDVQAGGAEAILKWLEDNVKSPLEWPADPNKPLMPVRFEFDVEEDINLRGSRTDTVTLAVDIPPDVLARAREANDPNIITTWLGGRDWSNLAQVNRVRGEDSVDIHDSDWAGYTDSDDIAERVRHLMQQTTN